MAGSFLNYASALKWRLTNHKLLAQKIVAHNAERGRLLEKTVVQVLEEILPKRFRIGTGFIVNSKNARSTQIDIVIYDDTFNAPIVLDGGIGIFPIECVYAVVEVKSTLRNRDIEAFSRAVGKVRSLAKYGKYYVEYKKKKLQQSDKRRSGSVVDEQETVRRLAPRAYLFAYSSTDSDADKLTKKFGAASAKNGAFVHGVCVLDKNIFFHQKAHFYEAAYKIEGGDAFTNFHLRLLRGIQSIPMEYVSLPRYFSGEQEDEAE